MHHIAQEALEREMERRAQGLHGSQAEADALMARMAVEEP